MEFLEAIKKRNHAESCGCNTALKNFQENFDLSRIFESKLINLKFLGSFKKSSTLLFVLFRISQFMASCAFFSQSKVEKWFVFFIGSYGCESHQKEGSKQNGETRAIEFIKRQWLNRRSRAWRNSQRDKRSFKSSHNNATLRGNYHHSKKENDRLCREVGRATQNV